MLGNKRYIRLAHCLQFSIQLKRFRRFEIFKKQSYFISSQIFHQIKCFSLVPSSKKKIIKTGKVSRTPSKSMTAQRRFFLQN